jgi:signal transduction histidine kinase
MARISLNTDRIRLVDDRVSEASARDLLLEVAHDLRSPLSAILMMADALRRGQSGPVTADQDRQLSIICRAALSLCATAADVVEYTKGSTASRGIRTAFSIDAVMDGVRDTVAPMLEGSDVDFTVDVAVNECRVGDASAFSRVMLNLVTNALKHTDRGAVSVTVREVSGHPDSIVCTVSDTGRGMAPTVLHAVFAGGEATSAPGRGLTSAGVGLAICRRLVASMGATLTAESRVGVGTRFQFTLELPRIAAVA